MVRWSYSSLLLCFPFCLLLLLLLLFSQDFILKDDRSWFGRQKACLTLAKGLYVDWLSELHLSVVVKSPNHEIPEQGEVWLDNLRQQLRPLVIRKSPLTEVIFTEQVPIHGANIVALTERLHLHSHVNSDQIIVIVLV